MPPLIGAVVATVATAFTVGFGGAVGFGALLSTTALRYFAINAALGYALNALTPKTAIPAGASYQANAIDAVADRQIVYGRTKIGGVTIYKEATNNNQYLHKVIAFTGHELQSFDEIYLNDELLTINGSGNVTSPSKYNGYVRIKVHLGTTTQIADTDLIADSAGKWTSNHRLLGVSYIYARFKYDSDKFPNGEPTITAVVKGKKVYDPRTGTTAWSANSALCLRDYLTSSFGLSEPSTNIDDVLFSAAANICDENVTLAVGGTEKRYTANGALITATQPTDIISALCSSMGGMIFFTQGKWRVKAAAWSTPELTFDEDDLRSAISIQTRNSRRDNFNIVRGKFRGEQSNWAESDYPELKSAEFLAVDGGLESAVDVNLPMTATPTTAQRIAKIALYRNRQQITVSATFGLRALNLQVGDVIYLTYDRAGWTSKTFEVQSWQMAPSQGGDIQIQMNLRELTSNVFDWNANETAFESDNTTLHDPFYVPPIGMLLTSDVRSFRESLTNVIYISVTALAADLSSIERVEVQAKKSSDATWTPVGTGQTGIYEFLSVDDSYYDVRVRAWNFMAVKGDWTEQTNFQVLGLAAPPNDVQMFRANVNGPTINLEWQAVPDLDLSYYKIRHSVEEAGASYANATTAIEKVSRPASSVTLPARPGTYTIKAYDKTGNASTAYSSFVVPSTSLETFGTTTPDTESTSFAGTKTGCSGAFLTTTAASGTGSVATLTFAAQSVPPFQVGYNIVVAGVTPLGYNGTHVVTGCTTTSVSFSNATTGAQTVAGNVSSELRINNKSLASTGASGSSGTATLTFATQSSAPFPVGENILVSGIAPDGYNGSFVVTACTTTSVSFANDTTAAQTVAGTITLMSATYEFTGYIDTTAARKVRSRLNIEVNRYAVVSGLWDDMTGTWDTWSGLWDDWTGAVQNADIDVVSYISVTQTDPAASPVWTSFQPYKAGDFYGRAFKFKVQLTSETVGVTPSISALSAQVQY